jgi:hypothetical protein
MNSLLNKFFKDEEMNQSFRNNLGHHATPSHGHGLRGQGYTRKIAGEPKWKRKMAEHSRHINRKMQ